MNLVKIKRNRNKYKNNVIASTNDSGFADGRSKASPDSEKIEQTATKLQLRNFSSVEQIQDSECAAIQKNSYRNDWIASSDLRPPRNDGGKYCSYCSSPEGDTSSSKRGTSFARLRAGSDSESQARWGATPEGQVCFLSPPLPYPLSRRARGKDVRLHPRRNSSPEWVFCYKL